MSCLLAPRRPLDARGAGCLPSPASPGRPVFCLADQLASGRSRSQGADRNPHPAEVAPVCFRESRHRRDAARNMLGNGLLAAHPALGNHGENLGTEGQFRIRPIESVEAGAQAGRSHAWRHCGRRFAFRVQPEPDAPGGSLYWPEDPKEAAHKSASSVSIVCIKTSEGTIKEYHSFN